MPPTATTRRPARAPRRGRRASRRGLAGVPARYPRAARAVVLAGAAFALLLFLAVAERLAYAGEVLPGVEVDGVDVAGDDEDAARRDLAALAADLEHTEIRARAAGVELRADPSTVGFDVDEAATLAAARAAGRSRNPFDQVLGTVLRRFRPDRVPLRVRVDERGLEGVLDGWAQQVDDGVQEAALRFEGTTVVPVTPTTGTGILRAEARRRLLDLLGRAERPTVNLPVGTVRPRVDEQELAHAAEEARALLAAHFTIRANGAQLDLTPEQLATALGTEVDGGRLRLTVDPVRLAAALGDALSSLVTAPLDASFEVLSDGSVRVVPSRDGTMVDLEAVGRDILRGNRVIDARLETAHPEHDTAWARSLGIRELVSTFTTEYPAGQARVQNIHHAADLLNHAVVEPGETFSLNERIGPRTTERGFVPAPVYYGEFTEDVGGGVSQVATTLFNAVFFGGYEDVLHKPHTIYFSRYPMGREATVNYPDLDLKFRNDSNAGILIRTSYSDTSVTVSFYGDKEGKVVTAEGPNVLATHEPTVEYIDWPLLPEGEEEEIEHGYTGYDVEVFRVIARPGAEPVRERFFWRYQMLPTKVLRGTMPPSTTTTATTAPPGRRPRGTTTTVPVSSTAPPSTTPSGG